MTPLYLDTVLSAYRRHRELLNTGFVPFTDRVIGRRILTNAGVPMLQVDEAPRSEDGLVTTSTWVPVWAELLMEASFGSGDDPWRARMIERALADPEYRAAAINVVRLHGEAMLRDFVIEQE